MLSRVAERMYWYGRYNERVENTARLLSVYSNLLMDLPGGVKHIWQDLIKITGGIDSFYENFKHPTERNVVKYLLTDKKNPNSLVCAVSAARENARTTREIIPAEAWEKINELYLYVQKNSDNALKQSSRQKLLNVVITYCHQMTGLLYGIMSHGSAYNFIHMGMNLERADMTTRIIDVGCINLLQVQDDIPDAYDNVLWMNVLRSLSAYQMYRQYVKDRVNDKDVVNFLLKNQEFPRSVSHCMTELKTRFMKLPDHDLPLREVTHTQRVIKKIDSEELIKSGLHEFIDEIQIDFADIHSVIGQTWFGHGAVQSQQQSS
jgi:uncharacterized alpha-E superfamily protein